MALFVVPGQGACLAYFRARGGCKRHWPGSPSFTPRTEINLGRRTRRTTLLSAGHIEKINWPGPRTKLSITRVEKTPVGPGRNETTTAAVFNRGDETTLSPRPQAPPVEQAPEAKPARGTHTPAVAPKDPTGKVSNRNTPTSRGQPPGQNGRAKAGPVGAHGAEAQRSVVVDPTPPKPLAPRPSAPPAHNPARTNSTLHRTGGTLQREEPVQGNPSGAKGAGDGFVIARSGNRRAQPDLRPAGGPTVRGWYSTGGVGHPEGGPLRPFNLKGRRKLLGTLGRVFQPCKIRPSKGNCAFDEGPIQQTRI